MRDATLDDIRRIMRDCAGVDDATDGRGDIADVPFADLGLDSLAMLGMAKQLENEFSVQVPDDALACLSTPREAVDHVNRCRAATVRAER
jgi:minimal PKS acyl carrier protein